MSTPSTGEGLDTSQAVDIELEQVTKRFPGQDVPAVEDFSLSIPAGEIVVFVGPSGCGKTTTMRMINRLVRPTSGRILIGGRDASDIPSDQLRRRIGYVVQQAGLLPHLTVRQNLETVPRLLKWDKARIAERSSELFELVGLPEEQFAQRFPRELSGGQQQRVGVARALAADPPVLLMDEPFGALDPITRDRLQSELVKIQRRVRKTIVFVTHDIDEAIKLGDRVVVLRERSRIAQQGPPDEILAAPADRYVRAFIGGGAAVKRLQLVRVEDLEREDYPAFTRADGYDGILRTLRERQLDCSILLDEHRRPTRWLYRDELEDRPAHPEREGQAISGVVTATTTLHDAMNEMLAAGTGVVPVVDDQGVYVGAVRLKQVLAALEETHVTPVAEQSEAAPVRTIEEITGEIDGRAVQAAIAAGEEEATGT
ncbi:ABC transporter ATP-binding protein [Patulibacter brassicae]|uniref:ABC transporter ATP-binding protein n=1 Tax=Patulibacter brassicae TaxID=1705717 RepID=A0ABU4VFR6_9ACTN|nr:ABC transporter ATP-binding protein [Patulibacter brassicae]MDX8150639.1 ABC transporter ATP-binding protein [Patulibacter brassicae]